MRVRLAELYDRHKQHILLDNNDIFKEFKNSVTEQLQNGFVDWWRRENYSDRSQGRRKFQSQSLKMYREKYDPAVCVRTSMANYRNENNRLINLPLYCITNWIWCDIKKFWKFPKWQGVKNWPLQEVASSDFVNTLY